MHFITEENKLPYEEPQFALIITGEEDIITTSDIGGGGDNGDGNKNDWTGEWDTDL